MNDNLSAFEVLVNFIYFLHLCVYVYAGALRLHVRVRGQVHLEVRGQLT